MSARTLPEYEEMEATLNGAASEGWHIYGLNVDQDRSLSWPYRITTTYRCEARAGRYIGEGDTRFLRWAEVRLSAKSLDALAEIVRALGSVEKMLDGAWGMDVALYVRD